MRPHAVVILFVALALVGCRKHARGIARGRLDAYASALPARGLDSDERCAAPGAIKFWLEDPDSSPCTGTENIVWSPTTPQWNPERCPRTVETHYVPLGDPALAATVAAGTGTLQSKETPEKV